ncbi:MAG TPA: fatty-acid synthase [Cyanobacteria bacterium UBA11372]|nr:fatty-acid synthase [Cyanobacteria bacterium UBA11372]
MPAKDLYHDTVRTALIKDGWTITDDPFKLRVGGLAYWICDRIAKALAKSCNSG